MGAHLLRVAPDSKSPLGHWRREGLTAGAALDWARGGGRLGVVPHSLRCSVLDVDAGPPGQLLQDYPPCFSYVSASGRGLHLWYRDSVARGNSRWSALGCQGDVRSGAGYVLVPNLDSWDTVLVGVTQLAFRGADFPAALTIPPRPTDGIGGAEVRVTGGRRRRARFPVPEGERNRWLTAALLEAAGHERGLRGDASALAALAVWYSESFQGGANPFTRAEASAVGLWVAKVSKTWAAPTVGFSAKQRALGERSGAARRAGVTARDSAIQAAREMGMPAREVGALHGISERQVRRTKGEGNMKVKKTRGEEYFAMQRELARRSAKAIKERRAPRNAAIMDALREGLTAAAVGARFGLCRKTIQRIKSGALSGEGG